VVSASPELFLRLDGDLLTSAPIKGTATTPDGLTAKDRAENVMITDLVRNDLQPVCLPGTVEVTALLHVEHHPGLVHLVSTVQGRLDPDLAGTGDLWSRVLAATYPPGSVSGAPKSAALRVIADLEPVPRGPYCGTVGWIDADAGRAELAVGIRTFWWTADDPATTAAHAPARTPEGGVQPVTGTLRFGTGAGITWGSDPEAEWAETELKARRLIGLASAPH
jgi:para-aminobenzoate synthetase component 1